MKREKKLLLVGTYCGLNKGDRLMQQVMIDGVLDRRPNTRVTLASPFDNIDRCFYPRAKVVSASRRNLPKAFIKCLLLLFPRRMHAWIARNDHEIAEYLDADLVVDLSGDMLTEDYGVLIAISHAMPLCYARLLRRRYMVIAQSIGPFRWTSKLYLWLLKGADAITVRDPISNRNLIDMKLSNVQETSDLGFLLHPPNVVLEDTTSESSKLRIGFAPSGLLLQKFSSNGSDVNSSIDAMANLMSRIAKRNDAQLFLIPHVQSPRGKIDDVSVCEQLRQRITAPVAQFAADLTPAEVKARVDQLDLLIAFRMHAALAGLDTSVPTIAVSYSHKTDGLFQRLGLGHWVVRNDENLLSCLENKVQELVEHRRDVIDQLDRVLPAVRKDARKNVELVVSELDRDE